MTEVTAIIQGDEFIFEQVYHRYHKKLYYYFFRYTRSETDAEELVQVSFIKLWNSRKQLSSQLPISQQLFVIARSNLVDLYRRQSRLKLVRKQYAVDILNEKMSEQMIDFELEERVNKAINQLPPMRRKVFRMSRQEQLSYMDISKELSISIKTVEAHIHKAIRQLRQSLSSFF